MMLFLVLFFPLVPRGNFSADSLENIYCISSFYMSIKEVVFF